MVDCQNDFIYFGRNHLPNVSLFSGQAFDFPCHDLVLERLKVHRSKATVRQIQLLEAAVSARLFCLTHKAQDA